MTEMRINGRWYTEGGGSLCHTNALVAVMEHGGTIVAGWLWQGWFDDGYIGIPHFWVVDDDGMIVDTSPGRRSGRLYQAVDTLPGIVDEEDDEALVAYASSSWWSAANEAPFAERPRRSSADPAWRRAALAQDWRITRVSAYGNGA